LARSNACQKSDLPSFYNFQIGSSRAARGDYEFFSRVDIELDQFYQEAHRNDSFLTEHYDPQTETTVYGLERMSPEDHAAFLMAA
jgi:hypothetical protein